jgi:hypothetical protein
MINFPSLTNEQINGLPSNAADSFLSGIYKPQSMQAELLKQHLANALSEAKVPYAGQEAEADLGLKKAQTKREEALANLPFGGHDLPGPAGQLLAVEAIGKMFGKDSPQYQQAAQAFDLEQKKAQTLMKYQEGLTNTLGPRYETPHGRAIEEQARTAAGLTPSGGTFEQLVGQPPPLPISQGALNQVKDLTSGLQQQGIPQGAAQATPQAPAQSPYSPSSPKELSDQYGLKLQKEATDADTRKRNLFATNIEKTLSQINPVDLSRYAGVGGVKKLEEQSKAPLGKESEEYDKYQDAVLAAEFLSRQTRQFYGDSIQPAMLERIDAVSNPATWKNNPALAVRLFNQMTKILKMETGTYREALKSTDVYQGKGASAPEASPNNYPTYDPKTRTFK